MNRRAFFATLFGSLFWRRDALPPITVPPKPLQYPPERIYVGRSQNGFITWDPRGDPGYQPSSRHFL